MTSPRDPTQLRLGLNPLATTALGGYTNPHGTPISAISMTSSHLHSVQTPASTIQPYNPQQWVAAPAGGPERPAQYVPEAQGKLVSVSPLPPPPYSPPRSQQQRPMSQAFEASPASTPTPPPRISTSVHRPSPEPNVINPSFPPPPGGSSRRFGLPSLRGRNDRNSSSPGPHPAIHSHRQSMIIQTNFNPSPLDHNNSMSGFAPPAARRAASAGAIGTPTSARSRSDSQTRWEPGMPIPPPPPGPPPAGSRSQSVQSIDRATVPIISPPTRRRPPTGVTSLGPVPPTPADWVDSDNQPLRSRGRSPGLTIDTVGASTSTQQPADSLSSSASSAGGLNRTRAVRHDKTIIQRRAESRTRQGVRGSIDDNIAPNSISDIVVANDAGGLTRRPTIGRSTPRSAGRGPSELPPKTSDSLNQGDSRNSTPRALLSGKQPHPEAATPPFSPYPAKQAQYGGGSSTTVAPKALPTPPPHVRSASGSRPRESSRPPASASTPVSKHLVITQTAEQFAASTIERFQAFAAKEATAPMDADRVRMFADFIVNESRIRRERYSGAIGVMGSEIFDLTRDLFRPMVTGGRRESNASQDEFTPDSSEPTRSHRGSIGSSHQPESNSHSNPGSAGIPVSPSGAPANANWTSNYMPSLSPILSMSVSDNHENGSSRGRPPSRWWEADSQGEPARMERSKRESKYMGVPKTQWVEYDHNTTSYGDTSEQGSASDYPPEKTGWHDQSEPSLTPQPLTFPHNSIGSSPVSTVNRDHFDVSRLVTMPPPYPRHYPAVNNNHPQLASIRTEVRSLSNLLEITASKEKFATDSSKRRDQFSKAAVERQTALRTNLQQEINSGNISYADAAAIESDSQKSEVGQKKELEKTEYELFQNQVVVPLNELLTDRIKRATDLFDDLSRRLFDNEENDADMPQEEGDDRPELLEKLTLLKWIFEARESLHRAIYDLLSDRNGRYCEVVLTPYRLSGNDEKLKSAEAFFAEDSARREYAFANEVLDRARDFRTVVEKAVERGVAIQLSAFWDIAPPLCGLLDNIPLDLEGFNIQIPAAEFEENPSYHLYPMQYLFSLLLHAEKSTYQFIESHTNLLCLLHEVKEAVVHAKCKVLETQTAGADGTPISAEERDARAQHMRQAEESRLTEDLKEKVRVVRDQWKSALGENVTHVKQRLGEWLLQSGGWDEALEEGGVGSQ
ncbi:hypothetical protein EDB81DRAFT_641683 [Dactylonectria macrodidyma]|uniref:Uncharacterized protein n=1 Tax=Dactylonectria macrodidyma TaxID=307937 RepID=A0A9P9FGI7_9HYPO|nr:hypothetical protein EDB81DRAFT_641683 [Dactylonectria macrodidyma]